MVLTFARHASVNVPALAFLGKSILQGFTLDVGNIMKR